MANTDDERALLTAAIDKDVETLTSLLQKSVYPDVQVCRHEKKERDCEEEREKEESGEMRQMLLIFCSLPEC